MKEIIIEGVLFENPEERYFLEKRFASGCGEIVRINTVLAPYMGKNIRIVLKCLE